MNIIKGIFNKIGQNKYLQAGIGFTLASLLLRAVGFLSTPIFSRLMDPSEYGMYNTYLAFEGIFYLLIGLALHSSIQNAKYEFEGKLNEYISSILVIVFASLSSWLIGVNVFYGVLQNIMGLNRLLLNILVVHSFASAIIQILQAKLTTEYNYKKYVVVSLLNAVLNVLISALLIVTCLQHDKSLARILGTFIPITGISVVIIAQFFRLAKPRVNRQYWKFALTYSLPIIPHGISQILLGQFDRIMIQRIISSYASGLYSFAYSLHGISATVTNAMQTVFTPWFYKQMNENSEEAFEKIRKTSSQYMFALLGYSSLVMLFSPELLGILGPEEYSEAKYVCIPILMGCFFSSLYSIPTQVEYYHKKTGYIAISTMMVAALNMVLNMIFIPKYGYIASAYTTVVSFMAYFIAHYILSIKIQGRNLFDGKVIIGVSVGNLVLGFLCLIFIDKFLIRVGLSIAVCVFLYKPLSDLMKIKKGE